MATEVVMPRLGWDMKVGSVAEWLKRDGDRVEVGETICMITGDKATTELEALDSGILRIPSRSPQPGEEVHVGTVLAYLVAADEDFVPTAPALAPGVAVASRAGAAPRALTPDASAPWATAVDSSVVEVAARGDGARIVSSPRARRAAAALGVDWRVTVGSGRGGRVLERDILRASVGGVKSAIQQRDVVAVPLHGVRRVTSERMALSAQTVAAVTLTTEADATTLVRLREQALAEQDPSSKPDTTPTYTDFIIKLVALALAEHPALNAELTDAGIVQHSRVHVAIAVDTPHGLFAPVVHDAAARSVAEIANESRRLIAAARAGTSRQDDLIGATFTITNLGMFEIDVFTPMVNPPQCAILGLGRIIARPVVIDEASEQVAVRRMLSLSLTFDHRLVDGAPAARFLQRVKHFVERPTAWLFR